MSFSLWGGVTNKETNTAVLEVNDKLCQSYDQSFNNGELKSLEHKVQEEAVFWQR